LRLEARLAGLAIAEVVGCGRAVARRAVKTGDGVAEPIVLCSAPPCSAVYSRRYRWARCC